MIYLSKQGIIHVIFIFLFFTQLLKRDLALRNILVTTGRKNKYLVKIADFGLARVTDSNDYYKSQGQKFQ